MTEHYPTEHSQYGLNRPFSTIPLAKRKDSFLMLLFLNSCYGDQSKVDWCKSIYIDTLQPLMGMAGSKEYSVTSSTRHTIAKRLKDVEEQYIIQRY